MEEKRKLTRREFLQVSVLATAGVALTACKQPTPVPTAAPTTAPQATAVPKATEAPKEEPKKEEPTKAPEPTATPGPRFKEAPMLAKLVEAGSLPPVDERLPMNPYIVDVAESIGKYGGNWRRGFSGVADRWGPTKINDRTLSWFDKNLVMKPKLLESWEVSADTKTWTLRLRKGVKFSDGVELTSEHFKWFFENQVKNAELTKTPPASHAVRGPDGKWIVCEMEFPDDYTVVLKFALPKPMLFYEGGGTRSIVGWLTPGHYMKQWHMDLVDDKAALETKVKDAGADSWVGYFNDNRNRFDLNPDRPQITPWLMKGSMAEERFVMERNPYYYATDPEGNQVPYIDTVTHRLFENSEMLNMWVINGEIDYQARHLSFGNYTLYKENEANGDYRVLLGVSAGHQALQLNLSCKNQQLSEFFNTRDVRIAVSHAINREEINELIWNGMLKPRQYSPLPMSPSYYPKLSYAYLEYDPAKANQLLDAAGYDKKGGDGIRLFPDGTPISFIIEGTADTGTPDEDSVQLVCKYLGAVGIKATYKYFERALYTEHFSANEIEAAYWGGDRTVLPLVPGAIIFRGVQPDRPWCPGYGFYYNNPEDVNGVKPPDGHFIYKIWDIWDNQVSVEPDPAKQVKLFEGILDIWAEELPMIGILGEMPSPTIAKNGFMNVLDGYPNDDTTGDEQFLQSESFYWDDPEKHKV